MFSILLNPRPFEANKPRFFMLTYPNTPAFQQRLARALKEREARGHLLDADMPAMDELRETFLAQIPRGLLQPGTIVGTTAEMSSVVIQDGDSLFCACSAAHAAKGFCHRAWVAPFLRAAGWDVVLDGVDLQARTALDGRRRVSGVVEDATLLPYDAEEGCVVQVGVDTFVRRAPSGWEACSMDEVQIESPVQTSLFGGRL